MHHICMSKKHCEVDTDQVLVHKEDGAKTNTLISWVISVHIHSENECPRL